MENPQPTPPQNVPQTNQTAINPTSQKPPPTIQEKSKKSPKIIPSLLAAIAFLTLGAGGFWFYQKNVVNKPAVPTTLIPTPTSSPKSTSAVPADWKTYTNQNLRLSFRYPSSWSDAEVNMLSTKTSITIKDREEERDLIARFEVDRGIYYNQALQREMTLNELIDGKSFLPEALTSEKITLKDWKGMRFTNHMHGVGHFVTQLFLAKPNNPTDIISITYRHASDPAEYKSAMPKTFDQILSTFKFLD